MSVESVRVADRLVAGGMRHCVANPGDGDGDAMSAEDLEALLLEVS